MKCGSHYSSKKQCVHGCRIICDLPSGMGSGRTYEIKINKRNKLKMYFIYREKMIFRLDIFHYVDKMKRGLSEAG
jgi:hypothetical protein